MTNLVLEVNNLSKTYTTNSSQVNALENITFNVNKGEFVIIMGTSGSGKSTLLNILCTLDRPTSGTVKINGIDDNTMYEEPNASTFRLNNLGFVFQNYNLLKDLSVAENLAIPLLLKGESAANISFKVNKTMSLLGLTSYKEHRPTQLSGGQQQRVAIGRAIITEPPILFADEPTGNLDYNTTMDILHIFIRMRNELNQSILLVTHDPLVATYADRVLFFHNGSISAEYKNAGERDLDNILHLFKSISEGRGQ